MEDGGVEERERELFDATRHVAPVSSWLLKLRSASAVTSGIAEVHLPPNRTPALD